MLPNIPRVSVRCGVLGVVKLHFVIMCWSCSLLPLAWLALIDENMMLSVVAGEGVVQVFQECHSHTLTVQWEGVQILLDKTGTRLSR